MRWPWRQTRLAVEQFGQAEIADFGRAVLCHEHI